MSIETGHEFERSELERTLSAILHKTLEEVDSAGVLQGKKGNKGYPGAIIEQSVLGYPADNKNRPDLVIDGVETELKTTGVRGKTRRDFTAKEPVSITAVKPEHIIHEEFPTSVFWHKCAHLVFVYYWYKHKATPKDPQSYADFTYEGYDFIDITPEEREWIEHDWKVVRDFIRELKEEYGDQAESQYGRISSELNRHKLTVLDTAPKWPNPPRFRFKRKFVDSFVNRYFGQDNLERIPGTYTSFSEVDAKCHEITRQYSGKTLGELFREFGIRPKNEDAGTAKQAAEQAIVRMFGGKSKKLSQIELFQRFSIEPKSITLTKKGHKTEDMKLGVIDFDEVRDTNASFEESAFRAGFADPQLLAIVFVEPSPDAPLSENKFLGFKRYVFSDDFIECDVRQVWDEMRRLIFSGELRSVPEFKANGEPIINKKSGTVRETVNWPKSKDNPVFLRGSGRDAKDKTLVINGVRMYRQNVWVHGNYIAQKIKDLPYL